MEYRDKLEKAFWTFYVITIILCIILTCAISPLAYFYQGDNIPSNITDTIKNNLQSTPLMDILSGRKCYEPSTSNVLGYFYGSDEGYIENGRSYSKKEKFLCWEEDGCYEIKAHEAIAYEKYKGQLLCTSKRPNKNYFDYLKQSVLTSQLCPNGQKKCGKLDNKRDLCVNENDICPINDIVYNAESEYNDGNIKYTTIKIYERNFLHYSNEKTDNYIITNLTVLGGSGKGYPCGANDNSILKTYSKLEKNYFCEGDNKNPKYFFYKELSITSLESFYRENFMGIFDLPEYEKSKNEYMTLFATGYLTINEEDTKIFGESPLGLELNNYYSNIQYKCSLIAFIAIIFSGSYSFYFMVSIACNSYIVVFIFILFLNAITLLIIVCGVVEYIFNCKLFGMTSDVPKFFSSYLSEMKSISGLLHFVPYLCFLIFQIVFQIIIYKIHEYEHPKPSKPLIKKKKYDKKKYDSEPKTGDDYNREKYPIDPFYNSSDYKSYPQPQIDNDQFSPQSINDYEYDKNYQIPNYSDIYNSDTPS